MERKKFFCIYLFGEVGTSTLIKAYIQLDSARRRWRAVVVEHHPDQCSRSAESPSLTFTLEKGENVVLSDWTLDVSDQGSFHVAHEGNLNLRNTTS